MLKISIVMIFSFFVGGCSENIKFSPDNLPDGYVGKHYSAEVTISGGKGPVVDLNYEFQPEGSGLILCFFYPNYYTDHIYNKFIIEGTPNTVGDVKLTLKGGIVASGGYHFEKTYLINISK